MAKGKAQASNSRRVFLKRALGLGGVAVVSCLIGAQAQRVYYPPSGGSSTSSTSSSTTESGKGCLAFKRSTLISGFEDLGEWSKGEVQELTADTINFKQGSQGIKWTSMNGVRTRADRTLSVNAVGKHFELWVYVDHSDNLQLLDIYMEVSPDWARYFNRSYSGTYLGCSGDRPLTGWWRLSISRANFIASGGATKDDWATVSKFRLAVTSRAGTTANVTFDDFRMVTDRFAGNVTLRFDDGLATTYNEARKRMDAYGFRGVAAVSTSLVPLSLIDQGHGLMTPTQLKALESLGWDIVSHSNHHIPLSQQPEETMESELRESQQYLIQNGLTRGSRFFIPPEHDWNPTLEYYIKKYYQGCQFKEEFHETIPPGDPYRMKCMPVKNTTPVPTVQGWIDAAKDSNAWLTLVFHGIVDPASEEYECTPSNFQSVIDYIHSQGIDVVTFSDVFDELIPT